MRARYLPALAAVLAACGAGSPGAGSGGATTSATGGQGGSRADAGGTGWDGAIATGGSLTTGGTFAAGGTWAAGAGGSPAGGNGSGAPAGGTTTKPGDGSSGAPGSSGDAGTTTTADTAAGGSGAGGAGRDGGSGGARAEAGIDARPDATSDAGRDARADAASRSDAGSVTSDGAPCPHAGNVTYTLAKSANPTAAEQEADRLITAAMDKAVYYYNCYANISKKLNVSYVADSSVVPTADGNINGSIRFGPDTRYMEHVTAMHEIAHTVNIGNSSKWSSMLVTPAGGGTKEWSGPIATAELRAITGLATDVVYGDSIHFWPYGLNYTSEWHSEADGIAHCRIVMALRKDMGLQ